MAPTTPNAFQPEALDANRRGELSDDQRRGFRALSRYQRRNDLTIALYFVAGALLVRFFAAPTSSPLLRALIPVICLAIVAFLVVRAVTGTDALTRDLRGGKVESVEGAIGKTRWGGRASTYFLDVGDRTFKVHSSTYREAPDAGFVRVYFLPRSRKIVNLERLPNAPLPDELSARDLVKSIGAAVLSRSGRERNEARAAMAGLDDALKASVAPSVEAPPADARDPRPLEKAIVGTWKNALMKVTFSADGRVTTRMLDGERNGRWSIDRSGRLQADITGGHETADAWVAGNQLTITVDGMGMTFTRDAAAVRDEGTRNE